MHCLRGYSYLLTEEETEALRAAVIKVSMLLIKEHPLTKALVLFQDDSLFN